MLRLVDTPSKLELTLFTSTVPAGFPSPADDTVLPHLLAQQAAPREELGRRHAMATGHRAHTLLAGIALRNDRGLHLWRPVPALAHTGEDLKAPHTAAASIIT